MNILVTGANGFLGRNLTEILSSKREKYNRVALLSRKATRLHDFESYSVDLLNPIDIPFKADLIIHLAAQANPMMGDVFDDNVKMTRNVINYAKKVGANIAFSSSSSIYGNRSVQQKEWPTSLYGVSKATCEKLIMAECHLNDLSCYIFNLTANVGKYTTHGAFFDLRRKVLEEEKIVCFGADPGSCKPYMLGSETCQIMMDDLEWYAYHNPQKFFYRHIHPLNPISIKTIVGIMQEHYKTNKPIEWTGQSYKGDNLYVFPLRDSDLEMKTSQEYIKMALEEIDGAQR